MEQFDEIREWQTRPLEDVDAVVYFDAVRVRRPVPPEQVRDEDLVRNKAVYLGIGVTCAGRKEVLGVWIEQTEGAVLVRGDERAEGARAAGRADRGGGRRGHFPNDRSATKLIYLALRGVSGKWRGPPDYWHAARVEFAIHFGDRFDMEAS